MTAPTESLTLRSTDRARGGIVDVAARDLAGAGGTGTGARRLHPLMAAAAVSVIVLSATGVAALTGMIGPKHDATPATVAATQQPAQAAAAAAPLAQAPATSTPAAEAPRAATEPARPATTARPAPRPAPHPVSRTAAPVQAAPVAAQGPDTMPATPPAPMATTPVEATPAPAPVAAAPARAADWGTVQSVREVKVDAQPSAVGTVAGGVLGAVLGHQMGKGRGRDVGTVLGGIGGAFAGRAIESKARATNHWEMTVRLDDGTTRTFSRGSPWVFQAGERVHLVDGQPTGRG